MSIKSKNCSKNKKFKSNALQEKVKVGVFWGIAHLNK